MSPSRRMTFPFFLALPEAHLEQVMALQRAGINLQAFAMWAFTHEMDLDLAFDLLITLPRAIQAIQLKDSATPNSTDEAKRILNRYAAYARQALPEGISQAPPRRPAGWSLDQLKPQWIRFALDRWETRTTHGSEARLQRPGDGPYATAMAGFLALGTDELTFGELSRLIESHVSWTDRAIEAQQFLPDPRMFGLVDNDGFGLFSWHELHFLLGGGLGVTPSVDGRHQAGDGGERDFFALHANFTADKRASTSELVIKRRWEADIVRIRKSHTLGLPIQRLYFWERLGLLLSFAELTKLSDELTVLVKSGFFADPVAREQVRPWFQALLQHPTRSKLRRDAALALAQHLSQRARRLNTISVAAVTGRIQMVQATARYLDERQIKVSDPNQSLNITDLYRTYRRMLARGELTTEATVRGWLVEWDRKWGVPFGP